MCVYHDDDQICPDCTFDASKAHKPYVADEAPARQHPGGITLRCWLHEDDQICPDCTS